MGRLLALSLLIRLCLCFFLCDDDDWVCKSAIPKSVGKNHS